MGRLRNQKPVEGPDEGIWFGFCCETGTHLGGGSQLVTVSPLPDWNPGCIRWMDGEKQRLWSTNSKSRYMLGRKWHQKKKRKRNSILCGGWGQKGCCSRAMTFGGMIQGNKRDSWDAFIIHAITFNCFDINLLKCCLPRPSLPEIWAHRLRGFGFSVDPNVRPHLSVPDPQCCFFFLFSAHNLVRKLSIWFLWVKILHDRKNFLI